MAGKKIISIALLIVVVIVGIWAVKKINLSPQDTMNLAVSLQKLYLPSPNIIYQEITNSAGMLPPGVEPSHQEVTLYKSGKLVATGTRFNSTHQLTPQAVESLNKTISQSDIFNSDCKKENIYADANFTYHIRYRYKLTTITSHNGSCLDRIEPIISVVHQYLNNEN